MPRDVWKFNILPFIRENGTCFSCSLLSLIKQNIPDCPNCLSHIEKVKAGQLTKEEKDRLSFSLSCRNLIKDS